MRVSKLHATFLQVKQITGTIGFMNSFRKLAERASSIIISVWENKLRVGSMNESHATQKVIYACKLGEIYQSLSVGNSKTNK